MKRNRYHRGKVPRVNFERKRGNLSVCESDCTHGEMFFLRYIFTVLKFVQFPVKWAFFRIFCTKSNTKRFPIFILDFTLVIYLTRCYTMPVKQLQNYFRKEYRRIFQWLILSSGLASREENGHTL